MTDLNSKLQWAVYVHYSIQCLIHCTMHWRYKFDQLELQCSTHAYMIIYVFSIMAVCIMHYAMCIVQCIGIVHEVWNVHYALCNVQCEVQIMQCVMHIVHYISCNVQCAMYIKYIMCNVRCRLCNVHNGERNMRDLTAAAEVECARSAIILTNTLYPWSSSSSSSLGERCIPIRDSLIKAGIAVKIATTVTLAAGIILLVQISLVKKMGSAEMTQLIPDIHGT